MYLATVWRQNLRKRAHFAAFLFSKMSDLDLADLPLVKFDFSCNKVSTIPVCYRKMTQLQSLQLENNPLQSPPAQVTHTHTHACFIHQLSHSCCWHELLCFQICMKGKIHIFKYLAMEACRSDKMADALYLPVTDRLSLTRPTNGRSVLMTNNHISSIFRRGYKTSLLPWQDV